MSFSPTAPLVSLFFLSSFAVAAISAPLCDPVWGWSFNSLSQNPCMVAAYMMSTCYGGSFEIGELIPPIYAYPGPTSPDNSDICICSTIVYSLISACGGCQGEKWVTWSQYMFNCTNTIYPSSFPNPVPAGTRLPQWALLDVTITNDWDLTKSFDTGDNPELGPGTILSSLRPSGSASTVAYFSTPASSSSSYSTSSDSRGSSSNPATPMSIGRHSSNTGAIAGGIAASMAVISVVIAAVRFYRRRRRPSAPSVPSESDEQPSGTNPRLDQVPQPMPSQVFVTPAPASMPSQYNPDDPATYPVDQGTSRHTIHFNYLSRPAEIYTRLPPRRIPKDRDSDIVVCPFFEPTLVWQGYITISVILLYFKRQGYSPSL